MERNMETTCRYYSKWLGQDEILLRDFRGTKYLYSEERNSIPFGYGTPFDLYVFCQKERMIISYGDKGREQAGILTDKIKKDMSATEVKLVLERIFGQKADHNVKYVFAGSDSVPVSEALVLVEEDYGKYESFWRKCHPECLDTVWLKDYFNEMVQEHMCIGVFVDDILVSCTDAPGMPYMENEVQEIGINPCLNIGNRDLRPLHAKSVFVKFCVMAKCHSGRRLWEIRCPGSWRRRWDLSSLVRLFL